MSLLWYLGQPYTRYFAGQEAAYKIGCENAALLVKHGVNVYAPICHTHPIAEFGLLDPLDHELWVRVDEPFVNFAHGLIVLMMEGWADSRGLQHEIAEFRKAGKPILYMTPGQLPEFPKDDAPETCLQEAQRLVYGERGRAYGHPHDDYSRAVGAFNALTNATLTPAEGVLFMMCVKLSRMQQSPGKRDHYTDLAGYAECGWQVQEREREKPCRGAP